MFSAEERIHKVEGSVVARARATIQPFSLANDQEEN